MEGVLNDIIVWIIVNAMLIIGVLFILYGLVKMYKHDNLGIWILAIGVLVVALFFSDVDWERLLSSFRSSWESKFR